MVHKKFYVPPEYVNSSELIILYVQMERKHLV